MNLNRNKPIKGIISLGDSTNYGGKVISASTKISVFNKGVAGIGDRVQCLVKNHEVNPIIDGDSQFSGYGKPAAFHGHKTACDCGLISSLSNFGINS
ncbi:PAAR domain-containing protein [Snodgrassella sp.]|uniref:PAAR domain-containing protein n=1 Tax=Snodgrassella sp. TaxID=2815304 RepID=UPI00338DD672